MTNLQDMFDNNSPFKFTSNKKVSEETRKKQSEAAKKRKAKESTKLKLSKIQKKREAKKSRILRQLLIVKLYKRQMVFLQVLKSMLNLLETYRDWETDRKSTRLNSSHSAKSRMPSSA